MMYILSNAHWFALLLGGLIFFHELGHFLVAKACGIKVLRFSMGFGPRLLSFTRGETEYSLSLLPLGGYVKMLGEGPGAEVAEEEKDRAFANKSLWQRTAVVLAGPIANFLVAFVVYVAMFTGPSTFGAARIGILLPNEAAAQAGLRVGDEITAIGGHPVERWAQVRDAIAEHVGTPVAVSYRREGVDFETTMTPSIRDQANEFGEMLPQGRAGISLQYLRPVVAIVDPESPAAKAGLKTGDEIRRVGKILTEAWWEVRQAVAASPASVPIELVVLREGHELPITLTPQAMPAALEGSVTALQSSADAAAGYTGLVNADAVVASIEAAGPAQRAGLQIGDRLVAVATSEPGAKVVSRPINVWALDLASLPPEPAHQGMSWTVQRGSVLQSLHLVPQAVEQSDEMNNKRTLYKVGADNDPTVLSAYSFTRKVGLAEAATESVKQVRDDMLLIVRGMGKMVQRKVPASNMGGPIMLFRLAEQSAKHGWSAFGRTVAVVSVNLGTLNLFPIPVLDGGHLVFFAYEAVRRRAPSLRVREFAQTAGLAVLLLLMVLVFKNDFTRFIAG